MGTGTGASPLPSPPLESLPPPAPSLSAAPSTANAVTALLLLVAPLPFLLRGGARCVGAARDGAARHGEARGRGRFASAAYGQRGTAHGAGTCALACVPLHSLVDPTPRISNALACISRSLSSARCSLATWWLDALPAGAATLASAVASASPCGVAHASRGGRDAGSSSGGAVASVLGRVRLGLELGRRRRAAAATGTVVTWRR